LVSHLLVHGWSVLPKREEKTMTRKARSAAILSCAIGAGAAAAVTIFPAFASQGKEAAQDYSDGATGNPAMFVKLTDYRGRPVFIDPERVIRIRESGIAE
jgi:hypothetical protein